MKNLKTYESYGVTGSAEKTVITTEKGTKAFTTENGIHGWSENPEQVYVYISKEDAVKALEKLELAGFVKKEDAKVENYDKFKKDYAKK